MSKTYRPWNPNQQWLLPPSVHDWLPEDDLVYFIMDTVNELDISAITAKYEQQERGYPPYNPRMMVALLFYAYCRGIFSSRKIMQACDERLTFRVIVGDDIPNWRTISDFRKLQLKELEQLWYCLRQRLLPSYLKGTEIAKMAEAWVVVATEDTAPTSCKTPEFFEKSPLSGAGKHSDFQVTSWSSRCNIVLSFRHALCSLFLFSFD